MLFLNIETSYKIRFCNKNWKKNKDIKKKIIETLKLFSYKCKKRKRLFIYYVEKKIYNAFLNHIFIIEIVIINDFF